MPIVTIRQLARTTSRVLRGVTSTGRPAVVTKSGRPIAVVSALDADALEDWVLANAPEFVRGMREADADLSGGRTTSLEDFLREHGRGAGGRRSPRTRRATRPQ